MKKSVVSLFFLFIANSIFAYNFTYPDSNLLKNVKVTAVDAENGVIAWGTTEGVVLQKGHKFKLFNYKNSLLEHVAIQDLALCDGNLWVSQIQYDFGFGIFLYRAGKWYNFKRPQTSGIRMNKIVRIYADDDKIVWFGYYKYGVGRYFESVPPHFVSKEILHFYDYPLLCVYMQKTHLWLGSENGIVRIRTETPSSRRLDTDVWQYPDFPARACFDVCSYDYDKLLAATTRGIAVFYKNHWSLIGRSDGIKALPLRRITVINNTAWFGGPKGLQSWSEAVTGDVITAKDGLPSTHINDLCVDNNGNLLIATDKGAAILKVDSK